MAWKVKCEGQNLDHHSAGCDIRKSSSDNDNGTEDDSNNKDDDVKAIDNDKTSATVGNNDDRSFQPGIVAPPSDETESKLYRIF